jgi:hypothetical protein
MELECREKRKAERFATGRAIVEIQEFGRRGQHCRGELIDGSETGLGLFTPYPVRTRAILVLRACQDMSPDGAHHSPADSVRFHMVSAEVRWCQEGYSPDGRPGFRVGVVRLLPAV